MAISAASRVALLGASLLRPAFAEPREVEWHDEACAAGSAGCADEGDPMLSLRQLRATARHDPAQVEASVMDPASDDKDGSVEADAAADADYDPGLPGGWGEAADFVDATRKEEEEDLVSPTNGTLGAQPKWGSCSQYNCAPYYVRSHGCQCNSACVRHGSCCSDYNERCHPNHQQDHHSGGGNFKTLYHQTGNFIGPLILKYGFKPGWRGWCGGGIYFATSAAATNTKAIGADSHKGYLIAADVDVGRVKYMPATCDGHLNGARVSAQHFDSVSFDPGDGQEYIVYSNSRIHNIRHIPMR